jgi:carbamoyl-phosphate synthase large subunit
MVPRNYTLNITVKNQANQAVKNAAVLVKEGDEVLVKVIGIDERGKIKLSRKAILKEHEGRPNITDAIKNREIQLVINTPAGKLSKYDDSYIRKAAIRHKVPYVTNIAAAKAAVKGIAAYGDTDAGACRCRNTTAAYNDIALCRLQIVDFRF